MTEFLWVDLRLFLDREERLTTDLMYLQFPAILALWPASFVLPSMQITHLFPLPTPLSILLLLLLASFLHTTMGP